MPARTPSALAELTNRRQSAAKYSLLSHSFKRTEELFQLSHHTILYWREKTTNPLFHPKTHGGFR